MTDDSADEPSPAIANASPARELYFAYRDDLDLEAQCPSAEVLGAGAVRGYALDFAQSADPARGGLLTLRGIRSDATVRGVVLSVDRACLDSLLEHAARDGYERLEVHVERPDGEVRASSVLLRAAPAAPAPDYIDALRSAWTAGGLDPAGLEVARQRP